MLQALLQGKLSREHEQIEDILTSNVFGLLRYCNPDLTLSFLARATLLDGQTAFNSIGFEDKFASVDQWTFWPYWYEKGCHPCEPDVVFMLTNRAGADVLVLIEAKLNSGKSSRSDKNEMPSDQLAREWDNLAIRARAQNAIPLLIYLTNHFALPRSEIEESIAEIRLKRGCAATIAWLSWRELCPILRRTQKNPVQSDLLQLVERMDLTYFEGVNRIPPTSIDWHFISTYNWALRRKSIHWRYE